MLSRGKRGKKIKIQTAQKRLYQHGEETEERVMGKICHRGKKEGYLGNTVQGSTG